MLVSRRACFTSHKFSTRPGTRLSGTFGASPAIVCAMATAYIEGLQHAGGEGSAATGSGRPSTVCAVVKDFATREATGGTSTGPRAFAETLLAPFEAAVCRGQAGVVMPGATALDGIPMHCHRQLLHLTLRCRWGFRGVVMAHPHGITGLCGGTPSSAAATAPHGSRLAQATRWATASTEALHHDVSASRPEAGQLALCSGVDMELPRADCFSVGALLPADTRRASSTPATRIQRAMATAVTRVLGLKHRVGLLPHVGGGAKEEATATHTTHATPTRRRMRGSIGGAPGVPASSTAREALRAASRALASQGAVLLVNRDRTLPLLRAPVTSDAAGAPRPRLAVMGPCAVEASVMTGGCGAGVCTLWDAVRQTARVSGWDSTLVAAADSPAAAAGSDVIVLALGSTETGASVRCGQQHVWGWTRVCALV